MGKIKKKHNWKGRQQSDPQQAADGEKAEIVLELKGKKKKEKCESKSV